MGVVLHVDGVGHGQGQAVCNKRDPLGYNKLSSATL